MTKLMNEKVINDLAQKHEMGGYCGTAFVLDGRVLEFGRKCFEAGAEGAAGEASPRQEFKTWEDAAKAFLQEKFLPEIAAKYLADIDVIVAMAFFGERMYDKGHDEAASTAGPRPEEKALAMEAATVLMSKYSELTRDWDHILHKLPKDQLEARTKDIAKFIQKVYAQFFAAAPAEDTPSTCPRCEGTGKYQRLPNDPETPCAICAGTGKIQAEDVQLDVEAIATEQAEALFSMYQRLEFSNEKVIGILSDVLLRRVSGKGAQATPEIQLERIFDGIADSILEMSDEEILTEAAEQGIDVKGQAGKVKQLLLDAVEKFERSAPSPAPVPATPDIRRIQEVASDLAQELLDETRTRHNLEHGCWPGLVHIADKIEKAIKLATTQGTPEGAK